MRLSTHSALVWFLVLLVLIGIAAAVPGGARAKSPSIDGVSIDDFEDRNLVGSSGLAWVPLGDDLFGGPTRMRLEPLRGGASGSKGAMRVTATIGDGPGSVAGAWISIVPGGRTADLTGIDGVRLSVRGSGEVLVGVRRGGPMGGVNFMTTVTAGPDWRTVLVPFDRLKPQGQGLEATGWDPRDGRWLGVTSVPGAAGEFRVDVDDVAWYANDRKVPSPAWDAKDTPTFRALEADDPAPLAALPWRELARDPEGDGKPGLPDARALFVAPDPRRPLTWLRVDLQGPIPPSWMGVNLVLDTDGDPADGTPWWGNDKSFRFDRLVTAWVFSVDRHFEGSVGIATAEQAAAGLVTNDEEVHLALDRSARRVYLGVPSATLAAGTRTVAAVGSAFIFSDDLPASGGVEVGPIR
ncbi:MAG TPA: hypothetical protein VFD06_14035 [Candidatus Polarisedimenticolia bacterium]|nr:hypothetical protein [Candidatus Polarisedimenticolia bacterium]